VKRLPSKQEVNIPSSHSLAHAHTHSHVCTNLHLRLETSEKLRFQALQMLLDVRVSQKLCKKGAYKNRP
jgi:hypothetical protein